MYSGKKRRGGRVKERLRRRERTKARLRTCRHTGRFSRKQHFVTLYKLISSANKPLSDSLKPGFLLESLPEVYDISGNICPVSQPSRDSNPQQGSPTLTMVVIP